MAHPNCFNGLEVEIMVTLCRGLNGRTTSLCPFLMLLWGPS